MTKSQDVYCLGNALVDILIQVDDDYLKMIGLEKAEMHLVEKQKADELLKTIQPLSPKMVPGGSSANTAKGLGFLGGRVSFTGVVGDDTLGEIYIESMKQLGVDTHIAKTSSPTGFAITYITPDAERTFVVYLGAALELIDEHVSNEIIERSQVLHIEAYQLEGNTKSVIQNAIKNAHENKTKISMDLADSALIERNKELFDDVVKNGIDILFANAEEGFAFTSLEKETALDELAKHVEIAVLKQGRDGSLIKAGEEVVSIPAYTQTPIDTTGAGDSYAAGLLYGQTHGWNLETSGHLGNILAGKIIEQIGVDFSTLDKKVILEEVSK